MGEVMFSTLWYIRTSDCQRSLSLTSWTPITFQSYLAFWTLLGLGSFRYRLKRNQTGNGFKASPLKEYLQASKFILLKKVIKEHVTLQAL
jgi:hypothetical protein